MLSWHRKFPIVRNPLKAARNPGIAVLRPPHSISGTTKAAATALVAAALIASALVIAANVDGVDWGNIPGWLAVVASVGTFAGVFLAWRSLQSNLANRHDDEASLARLLSPSIRTQWPGPDGRVTVTVTLRNLSTLPFHYVRVLGVTVGEYGCQQYEQQRTREHASSDRKQLESGHEWQSEWVIPDPRIPWTPWDEDRATNVVFSYMDGTGRRWVRYTDREPERVLAPRHSDTHRLAFNAAMQARQPDGSATLDTRYWTNLLEGNESTDTTNESAWLSFRSSSKDGSS